MGSPLLYQRWEHLLFLNWSVAPGLVAPLIPSPLVLDLWDDRAWITLTPFEIPWTRAPFVPPVAPIRWLSGCRELNLRTYVRLAGEPGVWFLSLDATNPLATLGGRIGFSLPYFLAHAELEASEGERGKRYRFVRVPLGSSRLRFDATWTASGPARPAPAQSLESFLVERYTMYVVRFSRLARTRIFHPRWEIRPADVLELDTNVGEPYGLRVVTSEVVAYEQGATV